MGTFSRCTPSFSPLVFSGAVDTTVFSAPCDPLSANVSSSVGSAASLAIPAQGLSAGRYLLSVRVSTGIQGAPSKCALLSFSFVLR